MVILFAYTGSALIHVGQFMRDDKRSDTWWKQSKSRSAKLDIPPVTAHLRVATGQESWPIRPRIYPDIVIVY